MIRGCTITIVATNLIPTGLPEQAVPDEITALLNLLDNLEPAAGPQPPDNDNPPSLDPPGRGRPASPSGDRHRRSPHSLPPATRRRGRTNIRRPERPPPPVAAGRFRLLGRPAATDREDMRCSSGRQRWRR